MKFTQKVKKIITHPRAYWFSYLGAIFIVGLVLTLVVIAKNKFYPSVAGNITTTGNQVMFSGNEDELIKVKFSTLFENKDIVVDSATLELDGEHNFNSLTVKNNAKVTHSALTSQGFATGFNQFSVKWTGAISVKQHSAQFPKTEVRFGSFSNDLNYKIYNQDYSALLCNLNFNNYNYFNRCILDQGVYGVEIQLVSDNQDQNFNVFSNYLACRANKICTFASDKVTLYQNIVAAKNSDVTQKGLVGEYFSYILANDVWGSASKVFLRIDETLNINTQASPIDPKKYGGLILNVAKDVNLESGGQIDVSGKGYPGSVGDGEFIPAGFGPGGGLSGTKSNDCGSNDDNSGGGGGFGGAGGNGPDHPNIFLGGKTYLSPEHINLEMQLFDLYQVKVPAVFGSGGAGGSHKSQSLLECRYREAYTGGAGGGSIVINSEIINISSAVGSGNRQSAILANGADGQNVIFQNQAYRCSSAGCGGGGSGGYIKLDAKIWRNQLSNLTTDTPKVFGGNISGDSGSLWNLKNNTNNLSGYGANISANGGNVNGGGGRILIDAPLPNPSLSVTKKASAEVELGANIIFTIKVDSSNLSENIFLTDTFNPDLFTISKVEVIPTIPYTLTPQNKLNLEIDKIYNSVEIKITGQVTDSFSACGAKINEGATVKSGDLIATSQAIIIFCSNIQGDIYSKSDLTIEDSDIIIDKNSVITSAGDITYNKQVAAKFARNEITNWTDFEKNYIERIILAHNNSAFEANSSQLNSVIWHLQSDQGIDSAAQKTSKDKIWKTPSLSLNNTKTYSGRGSLIVYDPNSSDQIININHSIKAISSQEKLAIIAPTATEINISPSSLTDSLQIDSAIIAPKAIVKISAGYGRITLKGLIVAKSIILERESGGGFYISYDSSITSAPLPIIDNLIEFIDIYERL